jgi:hypothetical protein
MGAVTIRSGAIVGLRRARSEADDEGDEGSIRLACGAEGMLSGLVMLACAKWRGQTGAPFLERVYEHYVCPPYIYQLTP